MQFSRLFNPLINKTKSVAILRIQQATPAEISTPDKRINLILITNSPKWHGIDEEGLRRRALAMRRAGQRTPRARHLTVGTLWWSNCNRPWSSSLRPAEETVLVSVLYGSYNKINPTHSSWFFFKRNWCLHKNDQSNVWWLM